MGTGDNHDHNGAGPWTGKDGPELGAGDNRTIKAKTEAGGKDGPKLGTGDNWSRDRPEGPP